MTKTVEKLKLELSHLSIQERAEIASFLIHSLDENVDRDIESAWDAELAQRTQEINSGNASGEPSDQVFSELRRNTCETRHLDHSAMSFSVSPF